MYEVRPIAHIENDFGTKFGIPRQPGVVEKIRGTVVFEPEFANPDALRGLEGYTYLWLLWLFSENIREDGKFQPTVRPPILGGNVRMGVFATRSPFRPNHIGMSAVKIEKIVLSDKRGPVIEVSGADLMNGTPIIDIKPYIPAWDSHPEAASGFGGEAGIGNGSLRLEVLWPEGVYDYYRERLSEESFGTLLQVLENDVRPAYQDDPERVYGFLYAGLDVKFKVVGGTLIPQIPDDIL